MFKKYLIFLISVFLFYSCAFMIPVPDKNKKKEVVQEISDEDKAVVIYTEALEALKKGDSYFAVKKFKEVENLLPQSVWAAKSSLMASFADYSRNAYSLSIFGLERFIKHYPASENIPYAHYLIAMCYYEQILDEKKDLKPLLKAKEKFNYIMLKFPNTDYAIDASFKLDLIVDQLAAKEMSIARYYMETEKWIPALNRLKLIIDKYDQTVFIEEALHRLVEVYYKIGLINEAREAATILGYNYQSSEWYERSYKIFNKKYESKKVTKKKEMGLIRRKIKSLLE